MQFGSPLNDDELVSNLTFLKDAYYIVCIIQRATFEQQYSLEVTSILRSEITLRSASRGHLGRDRACEASDRRG